jgi:hypothetical protein
MIAEADNNVKNEKFNKTNNESAYDENNLYPEQIYEDFY